MLTAVNSTTQGAQMPVANPSLPVPSNSFEKQLLNLITESLQHMREDLARTSSATPGTNGQTAIAVPEQRQNLVTTPGEPAAMSALHAALLAAGHDPEEFNLCYREQEVFFPGGNYMDRTITATFANGYQESYGADLTAASPNGTVLSIEHTLRDIAAGTDL